MLESGSLGAIHRQRGGWSNLYYLQGANDGESWSEPVQVNDEENTVGDRASLLQVSAENVYSTYSADNGQTWSKNRRVNDVLEGVDDYPVAALTDRGTVVCGRPLAQQRFAFQNNRWYPFTLWRSRRNRARWSRAPLPSWSEIKRQPAGMPP